MDSQILDMEKGDYVKLSISDTGIGMTDETKLQIFEPFFSTKGTTGTGLGLSQVYGFVKKSLGAIRVYSEPGHGSSFSLYFPRHIDAEHAEAANDEQRQVDKPLKHGTGKVLVVDDEPVLLQLTKKILISAGYEVVCASNAEEALAILEKGDVDLLLSDVIMPDVDGFELAHIVAHKYPNTRVQLCSGFPGNQGKSVTNKALYKNILQKPYTASELLERVNSLLS